ncbi:phytanoyl-CoA dioxygenase family protein [Prochlorococcus marinus]|uniref:Phytanoyl-CoA dioxygenase n=1 Tax=Prochlorococcus marinus (strain MIT 9303) TaxID=59922 RepID=A2CBB5_PROM3|nr:phytanoyl-CoA dioxygenase family protein [Prochlorococcus marinus]ABM78775.1 Hypothetical protein P9303_20351 [Prochlorococcus marinus str. MIT 9303]
MTGQKKHNQKAPEFEANEIDSVKFNDIFKTFGSILIKNLLDKDLIDQIRLKAENSYNKADKLFSTDADLGISFKEHGHISAISLGAKNGQPLILNMFCNSKIPSLYKELLGTRIKILTGNSQPRRQHPAKHNPPVPFHQDASFIGNPGLVINSWIPLNEAGLNAPGIQIVLRPESVIYNQSKFRIKKPTTYEEIDISHDSAFSEITPDLLWAPIIAPGDVLFFSHLTIHRTYQTDKMKLQRISLEIRCMGM